MTRFARPSKKTSLEATPWHELVNSGGDEGSKTGKRGPSEDTHHSAGKKAKAPGEKRKKNFNVVGGSMKPKKSRKLEYQEMQNKSPEEGENGSGMKKNTKKSFKNMTLNSRKDNHKKMKMNKRLVNQKNFGKHTKISPPANTSRTVTGILDKKHEARRRRRAKGKACFHCRQTGHMVSECPLAQDTAMGVGNCYKCGSSEHTTKNCSNKGTDTSGEAFPFAKCFICGETGHIARTCPDNPKGLYPNGGGCKICGSVEHFRRDCPELFKQTKGLSTTVYVQNTKNKKGHCSADAEPEDERDTSNKTAKKKGPSVVKF